MTSKKLFLIPVFLFAVSILFTIGCSKTEKSTFKHEDFGGQPWVVDIEELTLANDNFRAAWWTGKRLQMTVMTIKPGGEIGFEAHPNTDQFLRLEQGKAKVAMGKTKDNLTFEKEVSDDWAIFIPAGYWHNLTNNGKVDVKLYSIYTPAEHPAGTLHVLPEDDDHHPDHK